MRLIAVVCLALASNCRISKGDQMHPSGVLSKGTYDVIGRVYEKVKNLEKYCYNAVSLAEIGLLTPVELEKSKKMHDAVWGAANILLQAGAQFDIINSKSDFNKYKLIILPDYYYLNSAVADKLCEFVRNGGKVIASFLSGSDKNGEDFVVDLFGCKMSKKQLRMKNGELARGVMDEFHSYSDYIIPNDKIGRKLYREEYAMYCKGLECELTKGESLTDCILPYFYREDSEKFCSHRQTPSAGIKGTPAVVLNKNSIYFAHPVFSVYAEYGAEWNKEFFKDAMDILLPDRVLFNMGEQNLKNFVNQANEKIIHHALSYVPLKKANRIEVMDSRFPVYNNLFK